MRSYIGGSRFRHMIVLGLMSLVYAIARFPGIDSHPGYFGMAWKLTHPSSFPGDIYVNYSQPAMFSLYSVLAKIVGPIWVDDRFQMVVYFFLVFATLFAIDRILDLLGVEGTIEKLGVFAVYLVTHQFIDSVTHPVDAVAVRPSTYAYPLGAWLAYFLLKDDEAWKTLLIAATMILTTLKNSWFPTLTTLLLLWHDRLKSSWKAIACWCGGASVVFFAGWTALGLARGTVQVNSLLFAHAMRYTENSEANPFMDGAGVPIWIAILVGVIWYSFPLISDRGVVRRLRAVAAITLTVYVLGAVYYQFAPDLLKVPAFVALAVSRSSWWTHSLVVLLVTSHLVISLRAAEGKHLVLSCAGLVVVYLFPLFDIYSLMHLWRGDRLLLDSSHVQRLLLLAFLASAFALSRWIAGRGSGRESSGFTRIPVGKVLLVLLLAVTAASYAYKLYTRTPDLIFTARTGILGGTPGAKWVNVNPYIRESTPETATVLALSGDRFAPDGSIKVRTGRTSPIGHEIQFYLDYPMRLEHDRRQGELRALSSSWSVGDEAGVRSALSALGGVDYLIVPEDKRIAPEEIGYHEVRRIDHFTIMRFSGSR